ncbi:rho GTPase-activating protein 18-like isoform X2 [Gigantopelta aegis]|uniref:rho GTPase-activating protein 18-like isoform X2 n=1 Tax=Gigantopelta aegis TaxID=1735272 RepID=UPI001B88E113|nr:rho GTPase-activating protein 18-like isoform X2 [Gigantopelta aegis]
MMASSPATVEYDDYWREFKDIESNKDSDEEEEELSKTPDEGEVESDWLKATGYGFVVSKLQDGKELSDDELEALTSSLTRHQAEAVKRRVDTLTTTMRTKQKQNRVHMKDIFPEQDVTAKESASSSRDSDPPSSPGSETDGPLSSARRSSRTFLKRGEYSMTGVTREGQYNVDKGVEALSIQPRSSFDNKRSNRHSTKHLQPIADSEISVDFHLEEKSNQAFDTKHDSLGVTRIGDLSESDMSRIRSLALIELTALFDAYSIVYSRPKRKKKIKEHGLFGVPLQVLVEHDQKRCPNTKVPLIFLSIIEHLEREALCIEGILRIPGQVSRVKQLRRDLEDYFYSGNFSWKDVLPMDAAAVMKQFLRELPVPLMTYNYLEAFSQVENIPTTLEQLKALNLLILLLPMEHQETLRVLLSFLRNIVSHSNENKMGLNNVAMIMAPNLFLGPASLSKTMSIKELELSKAAGTSNIVKMLVHYQNELWTIPPTFVKQIRHQITMEMHRKTREKTRLRFLGRKDKSEVYRKSTTDLETQDGMIRVQAPNLTKSSTLIQLDEWMTAGDVVAKFRRNTGSQHEGFDSASLPSYPQHHQGQDQGQPVNHVQSFRNPDNGQFADDNAYLFEVGGNIGERCLDPQTRMLDLHHVNPNAEWVIKVHKR